VEAKSAHQNRDINFEYEYIWVNYLWNVIFQPPMTARVYVNLLEGIIYIYIYLGKFDHDLTVTSLESWLVREIIPKWPNYSG